MRLYPRHSVPMVHGMLLGKQNGGVVPVSEKNVRLKERRLPSFKATSLVKACVSGIAKVKPLSET